MTKKYTAVVRSPKEVYGVELEGEFKIKGKPYWTARMYSLVGKRLEFRLEDDEEYRCLQEDLVFEPEWLTEIQEVIDPSQLKVDDKVEVSDNNLKWFPRHFHSFANNTFLCFDMGRTSWSREDTGLHNWKYCRLPEVKS